MVLAVLAETIFMTHVLLLLHESKRENK